MYVNICGPKRELKDIATFEHYKLSWDKVIFDLIIPPTIADAILPAPMNKIFFKITPYNAPRPLLLQSSHEYTC